jgi:hypothetical protein
LGSQQLSKTRYIAGLQCLRRLWLSAHDPGPREEPAPFSTLDIGTRVGLKAHLLFPGGVLVDEEHWRHAEAVVRTAALMIDERVPAIFEAAFDYEGIRIRADVLERLADGAWGLREVKSSSGVKDCYIDDIALQTFVLKGAGVALSSIELLHVNTAYVRGPDGICWPAFFAHVDVRDAVAARLVDLPCRLPAMRECLGMAEPPSVEPGSQCGTPYACEFLDRCKADKPADWIHNLPGLSQASAGELLALGVESISAIPPEFPLSWRQAIIRDATTSGKPYIGPDLASSLGNCGPPAFYLDFEAMMPAMPLYEGTRPYQTIPFQWSLHAIDGEGALHHREFLAESSEDPRRRFAETLIAALAGSDAPILVYSAYEKTRLTELAATFPDLSTRLNGLIDRLVDLLPIVRSSVYLPEFQFSNSIKSVAPALCPDFSYDDLEGVADGGAASAAFLQLASGDLIAPEEVTQIRAGLLAYCERDTLAMVKAHGALTRLALRVQPAVTV